MKCQIAPSNPKSLKDAGKSHLVPKVTALNMKKTFTGSKKNKRKLRNYKSKTKRMNSKEFLSNPTSNNQNSQLGKA